MAKCRSVSTSTRLTWSFADEIVARENQPYFVATAEFPEMRREGTLERFQHLVRDAVTADPL
jgi:hypothetical protein